MNKELLDPLGTMCKLIALNFNEISTKISIQDHVMTLQEPNGYQFLIRLYNGDGRENVSELYSVIIRLIKWFIIPQYANINNEIDESKFDDGMVVHGETIETIEVLNSSVSNCNLIAHSEEFRKMIRYLCDAFRKFQVTYKRGNVVLALQFYINILEDSLDGKYDNTRLPKLLDEECTTLLDYEKIKNLWDYGELQKLCKLYDSCFDAIVDESLGDIKNAYIKGYLKSIEIILESTDEKFKQLVSNSNRG